MKVTRMSRNGIAVVCFSIFIGIVGALQAIVFPSLPYADGVGMYSTAGTAAECIALGTFGTFVGVCWAFVGIFLD
jgi:hypothetical protein